MGSLVKIGSGVHAWIGSNGDSNAGAVETRNGVVAIDSQQTSALGSVFRTAIEEVTGLSTVELINTHFHLDHTAGNVAFSDLPIIAHDTTLQLMIEFLGASDKDGWSVVDWSTKLRLLFGSNVQELMPAGDPLESWFKARFSGPEYRSIRLLPPSITFGDHIVFQCASDTLRAEYHGPAHCDGDLIMLLPRQKIVFLGDLMFVGRFPWLGDCDLDGWIARLEYILSLDVEVVVPGHGQISTLREVATFKNLLLTLREATRHVLDFGFSEEAAVRELTFPQYAAMPRYREWLTANVRAIYRYLKSG